MDIEKKVESNEERHDDSLLVKAANIETGDLELTIKLGGKNAKTKFGEWTFATACSNDGLGCCGAYCKEDN